LLTPPSEAVEPKPMSDEDLRSLPTRKALVLDGERRLHEADRGKKALPAGDTARQAEASVPSPELLRRQQAFADAWQSRKDELDRLPPAERDVALSTLKISIIGGAK